MNSLQLLFSELLSKGLISREYAREIAPFILSIAEGKAQEREALTLLSANNQIMNALRGDWSKKDPFEEFPDGTIAIIPVRGMMFKYGSYYFWGADELTRVLRAAYKSPNIAAVILEINSGGGTISSIPVWLEALAARTKPVISLVDLCCSAAKYLACGTDYIMASNDLSPIIGSIGVMSEFPDFSQYYGKMGIVWHEVYADQSQDKNDIFKAAKGSEGTPPNYQPLKDTLLNPVAIKFQEFVKANRPNLNLDAPGILTGSVFTADKALEYGLIDAIGTMEQAAEKALELATTFQSRDILNQFLKS